MMWIPKMMRRDAAMPENRKQALNQTQYREVTVRQEDVDDESRTVDIAFSSDTPILRQDFFGKFREILVHDENAVRLDRMQDGAALLMDHNPRDQIGAVRNARIEDGVGRATVQFSKSDRASEIFMDVQDGIRSKISVGFAVHAHEEIEGKDGEADTIRITDWEPLEVSFVAIPADASVGVGRGDYYQPSEHQEHSMFKKQTPEPETDEARTDIEVTDAGGGEGGPEEQAAATRESINQELRQIGEKFGEKQLAEEYVELDGSVDELKRAIRDKRANVSPLNQRDAAPENRTPYIDMEIKRSGPLRGFRDEESAYRAGMWARGMVLGDERALRWCRDHNMRAMSESVFSKGGAIVPTEMEMAIIDLRIEYGVIRNLIRVVPMGSDTMTIPRRVSGVTAYAVGEGAEITASDKEWDNVNLVARKWGALTKFSSEYAEDAIIDVAQDLADEMAYAFAEKEDDVALNGDGTSSYHGIYGFRPKLVDGNHSTGAVDATSGDDTLSEIVAGDLDTLRGTLPNYARSRGNVRWLTSLYGKAVVFDAIARAAGGTTMMMFGNEPRNVYLGEEIAMSEKMPNDSTNLNNAAMVLYGAFNLAATMGDRRGFRFQVLNERYAENDQIGVLGTTRFDINVHDLGDGSTAGPVVGLVGNS